MKVVYLDCLLCFLRQALDTVRRVTGDKRTQREVLDKVAFAIPGFPLDTTPIELGRKVCRIVREVTGIDDPYREAKQRGNDRATALLPWFREKMKFSFDPTLTTFKLATAGTRIDQGATAVRIGMRIFGKRVNR